MTNATKAGVIAILNAAIALAVSFGVELSDAQTASVVALANAILGLWVAATYKQSPKRIPDDEG